MEKFAQLRELNVSGGIEDVNEALTAAHLSFSFSQKDTQIINWQLLTQLKPGNKLFWHGFCVTYLSLSANASHN